MKGARALAVQAEILGKGLRDAELKALIDKVADGPDVARDVARREPLIRRVEEGEMCAVAHHGGDLHPLVPGRVDAGRVVGAGVQDDDGAAGDVAQTVEHAIDVEAAGGRVVVGVFGDGEVDVCEDLLVVGPCWVGEVDGGFGVGGVEAREEEAAEVQGAGARDGLEGCDLDLVSMSLV